MRRGYTIILAITILLLLGSLAAVVCAGARMRGQDVVRDLNAAQARQLILAGLDQCPRLLESGRQNLQIPVPDTMFQSNPLEVFIKQRTGDQVKVQIHVSCGSVNATQDATFDRSDGAWKLLKLED